MLKGSWRDVGRRLTIFLLIVMFVLPSAACWDRREVEDFVIVNMVAFDLDPGSGMIRAIAQVANPLGAGGGRGGNGKGGGGAVPPFLVVEAAGHTVYQAVKNMETISTRYLLWSHLETLLFSEAMARSGIGPVLDYIQRERHTRLIVHPFVVQGDLRKLMEAAFPLEKLGGMALRKQHRLIAEDLALSPDDVEKVRVVLTHLALPGKELVLPRVLVLPEDEEGDGAKGEEAKGGEANGEEAKGGAKNPVQITGAALFRGDKLAGFLNEEETAGYMWLTDNVSRTVIVLACPGDGDNRLTVEILEASTQIKPVIEQDRVSFQVSIRSLAHIEDFACPDLPLDDAFINEMNRRLAAAIRRNIEKSLEKTQALGIDIYGLGKLLYRTSPREWQRLEAKWEEIFPEVAVDLEIKANIHRPGHIRQPARIR